MLSRFHTAAFALLIAALPLAANAADPADPTVAVPQPDYRSAFAGYRKAGFDEKRDWRQANDTVRDLGGHAGALQGPSVDTSRAAPAAPASAPAGMMAPMMPAHRGPHGHGQGGQRQ